MDQSKISDLVKALSELGAEFCQDTRSLKHVITTDEGKGCKVIVLGSVKDIDHKHLLSFKEEMLKNESVFVVVNTTVIKPEFVDFAKLANEEIELEFNNQTVDFKMLDNIFPIERPKRKEKPFINNYKNSYKNRHFNQIQNNKFRK